MSIKKKPKIESHNLREGTIILFSSVLNKLSYFNHVSVSTQTDLSFPFVLPDHIEEVLKPYFMNSVIYLEYHM